MLGARGDPVSIWDFLSDERGRLSGVAHALAKLIGRVRLSLRACLWQRRGHSIAANRHGGVRAGRLQRPIRRVCPPHTMRMCSV